MSYLIANIPAIKCFIRKEYLYDFTKIFDNKYLGEGELEPCYWVSVKSVKSKALLFESLITNYGALYDKLPISAFFWKADVDYNNLLPLDYLQIWDCFSYNISILEKSTLKGLKVKVYMKNKKFYDGEYLFTIDSCHSNSNELNVTLSETPDEHKSFNIIKLDNGQFTAQPNNRILWFDQSLIPSELKKADFKVCTKNYVCEDSSKWAVDNDDFYYEITEKG